MSKQQTTVLQQHLDRLEAINLSDSFCQEDKKEDAICVLLSLLNAVGCGEIVELYRKTTRGD